MVVNKGWLQHRKKGIHMGEMVWTNSRQSAWELDSEKAKGEVPYNGALCEVRLIDDRRLEVRYEDRDGSGKAIIYAGDRIKPDHFRLEGIEERTGKRIGHALLHMFEDQTVLVGYWEEGDVKGVWHIGLR
jgi:hypothetical protein